MVGFGAYVGNTVMTRPAVLIERVWFVVNDFFSGSQMRTLRVVESSGSVALRDLLEKHPRVKLEGWRPSEQLMIRFIEGGAERTLEQARISQDGTYGLIELMDNNPLVCAERASVPGALATLGLICLGPLARAEMLTAEPTVEPSFNEDAEELVAALRLEGFHGGVHLAPSTGERAGLLSVRCIAPLRAHSGAEVEELFAELYGRSFFLRPAKERGEDQILGSPYATYSLDAARLKGERVLEVRAIADADGKCGAAQMIHVFNVMAGFEEDLGLSRLPNMEQTR